MANEHIREATKKTRLIDVNDALERLRKLEPKLHVVGCLGIKAVGIDAFIQFLESRKTVDAVEIKHGRWKAYKPETRGYAFGFICSNCCEITYLDYAQKECDYNYCPNCGAKMDGDKEDG